MSASLIITVAALAVLAAYVCRVDVLSWAAHPWLMAAHMLGVASALWAASASVLGDATASQVLALAGSGLLLVALYSRMPKAEPHPPDDGPAAAPASVRAEALRHVSGGAAAQSARRDTRKP
jgi:hypothetical protein